MTLILGGSGQLGTAFRRLLPEAAAPSHEEFDLSDVAGIATRVEGLRPERIINCAAYTAVDAAEADEETANLINGAAVGELAEVAHRRGIPLVTFSTDYVFDGESKRPYTETSEPNPINAYGRSKLLGERAALQFPGSLVVRTSWLFSATHPNFVATILAEAAESVVRVVADQWGRPTPVPALATRTLQALEKGTTGLLHLASPPTTTWFELAREVCRSAGIDPDRVVSCSADQLARPARRPRCVVLTSYRGGVCMPDWRVALSREMGWRGQ